MGASEYLFNIIRRLTSLILLAAATHTCFAQLKPTDSSSFKIICAGKQYDKNNFHQWLWGRNRRAEWTTPVHVKILWLDSVYGGLKPFKTGGGNETKTLHLRSSSGKDYTLRSINKSRKDVVLPEYAHTFIEDIINDGVSMSYPYGAFAVPVMEETARIYHTNPQLVYLPAQTALDTFNEKFGNDLYLFEQRLSGNWSDADNLGNFKYFTSTYDVIKNLQVSNNSQADQFAFLKARLFDMLVADWDRHEDNWQWGSADTVAAVYYPVPRDRDQAFYTHNGVLIDRMLVASGLGFMQNFDTNIPDIRMLNYEERNMDRFFTNKLTMEDWINTAKQIQHALTDNVIEQSIKQLPPEIFSISGKELISKLKARRDNLLTYAKQYYLFLAKRVEITGTRQREYFYIHRLYSGETSVEIFKIDNAGKKTDTAVYRRIFKPAETKEIILYGIDGEDIYTTDGVNNLVRVHIIGGRARDSIIEFNGDNKITVYDNQQNIFQTKHASLHFKKDSLIHTFNYAGYYYNKSGFAPSISYNNEDRFYIGFGYGFTNYAWRKTPFQTKQKADLHYSLSQKAISANYAAIFPDVINKWNITFSASYDAIRWTNFFGLGNETHSGTTNRDYFRMRTKEWLFKTGLNKNIGKSSLSASIFLQSAKILSDTERYISKIFIPQNIDALEVNNYAGLQLSYTYLKLDDSIVPQKGFTFLSALTYTMNTSHSEFFQRYFAKMQAYIPLFNHFSLAIKTGGGCIIGNNSIVNSAEFYEHTVIGGPDNLRGFKRERFWGKAAYYNNNELRYLTNLKTHILNATTGFFIFFDDGRVWIPEEKSNLIHTAYGTGIIIAPFNKLCTTFSYGISKESKLLQIKINKLF